jgi:hypothetical protein
VTSRGVFPTGFALLEGGIDVTDGRDSLKRFDTCNSRANGSFARIFNPVIRPKRGIFTVGCQYARRLVVTCLPKI